MPAKPRRMRTAATLGVLACLLGGLLTACDATPQVAIDLPTQSPTDFADETTQQLQDAVAQAMAAAGASGAIVGVWAPWAGEWTTAVGTQSMEGGADVSEDMTFRIARLTRPMICDVLYAVAEQGAVSLDDSPSEYVAGTAELSDVTLEQLCDSTSGVASYGGQLTSMWVTNPERVWDPRELASYGLGKARNTDPGTAYVDSDAGYVVLGLALERATGRSAEELIGDYVAGRLGLASTVLPASTASAAEDTAPTLHGMFSLKLEDGSRDCAAPTDLTDLSASVGFTDSGVVADLADVRTYVQALASGALTPDGIDRFADAKPAYNNAPSWLTTAGGAILAGSLVGQSGSIPGYAVAAFADGTTGLTVAVVLNNSTTGTKIVQPLAWELAAIASKTPAASGETAPEAGLPWTAEQQRQAVADAAMCPLPEQQ